MTTLSFELSKKLNEAGLLDDIKTEYIFTKSNIGFGNINYKIIEGKYFNKNDGDYKTLTIEETIEFLSVFFTWNFRINKGPSRKRSVEGIVDTPPMSAAIMGETLLEAIEKMLEYLLKNKVC